MSSGHGINTRQGRCYPFWTEVTRCREEPDSNPEKCKNYVEDFMECLFHKKEVNFVTSFLLCAVLICYVMGRFFLYF